MLDADSDSDPDADRKGSENIRIQGFQASRVQVQNEKYQVS